MAWEGISQHGMAHTVWEDCTLTKCRHVIRHYMDWVTKCSHSSISHLTTNSTTVAAQLCKPAEAT
jgi:hypothetical protein